MKVRKLMQKELVAILPGTSIHEAARTMKEQHVGALLIVEEGQLQGIVTDRDITMAVAAFKNPYVVHVSDFMVKKVKTIEADDDIETALKTMKEHNIRRLPVQEKGRLVGMLSCSDLAVELKEELTRFMDLEEAFVKH